MRAPSARKFFSELVAADRSGRDGMENQNMVRTPIDRQLEQFSDFGASEHWRISAKIQKILSIFATFPPYHYIDGRENAVVRPLPPTLGPGVALQSAPDLWSRSLVNAHMFAFPDFRIPVSADCSALFSGPDGPSVEHSVQKVINC